MRKLLLTLASVSLLLTGCGKDINGGLMITLESQYPLPQTLERFTAAITQKGYAVSQTTDHTKRAKDENIYLHPTTSLTLDNPKVFSALLTCNPSLAIDLPVRVVAYSRLGGAVSLSYTQPEYWSLKHNIKDKNCIAIIVKMARDFDEAADSLKNQK